VTDLGVQGALSPSLMLENGKLPPRFHMDWSGCSIVEVVPGKVSGAPILKGTRVQADSIVENYESGSPVEEISENFHIPVATIREVLAFAFRNQSQLQP
jgi:uncharacterized protein (DUF433 family)